MSTTLWSKKFMILAAAAIIAGCGLIEDDADNTADEVTNQETENQNTENQNTENQNTENSNANNGAECDINPDDCENNAEENHVEDERAIRFILRPDSGLITRSHLAWEVVPDVDKYEVVLFHKGDGDEIDEVFAETVTENYFQIPREYREKEGLYVRVRTRDADGDVDDESSDAKACYGCVPYRPVCSNTCDTPEYSYSLTVWSHENNVEDSFIEISAFGGVRAYSATQYEAMTAPPPYISKEWVGPTSTPVYDQNCNPMTGLTYFVEKTAEAWQPAVQAELGGEINQDGEAFCGTYSTLNGLIGQFNDRTSVSPPLVCQQPCPGSGSGGSGVSDDPIDGWPWGTLDDMLLGPDIPFDAPSPTHPGWADDIEMNDMLNALTENIFDVGGDEWSIENVSLTPVGNHDRRIDLDLQRWEDEGPEYIREVTMALDEGLYLLNQYYGGDDLYPQALMHR